MAKIKKIIFQEIGPGLKELRGDRTLKELGALLNLTVGHICELERGSRIPSLNVVDRYARRLDVKVHLSMGEI